AGDGIRARGGLYRRENQVVNQLVGGRGLGESSYRRRSASRPAARRSATARIVVSENVSLDGVIQDPAGVEGFSRGGWVGLIGGQGRDGAANVALDRGVGRQGLSAGPAELRVLGRAVAIPKWPVRGQVEQLSQVRRFLDSRCSRLEQHDGNKGRRDQQGLEAEARARWRNPCRR